LAAIPGYLSTDCLEKKAGELPERVTTGREKVTFHDVFLLRVIIL
jgi:hypothetical protein